MNTPHFLGWHAPAIELVADFLTTQLSERDLARATVVVPTAESRRLLKEYMAERLQRPVLMPHIVQPGNLMEQPQEPHDAGETETLAAWFKVMHRVAEEVTEDETGPWFDLFPKAPVGNTAPWIANMVRRLMHLRSQMEQECLTSRYAEQLQHYAPDFTASREDSRQRMVRRMGARWHAVQRLFRLVDEDLHHQELRTKEEQAAAAARHPNLLRRGSLLVLACVPEISPLNELFIRRAAESGQRRLCVLVNAPQDESRFFDFLGRPLVRDTEGNRVSRWLDDAIPLLFDAEGRPAVSSGVSVIQQAADAEDMGRKAVALAADKPSDTVTVAVCDNAMAPAVQAAFLRAEGSPWCLNLPEGRAASATQEGALPAQLTAALQVQHRLPLYIEASGRIENNEPGLLEPLRALLGNAALRRCFAESLATDEDRADLRGFDTALDEIFRTFYPSHMQDLVRCFTPKGEAAAPASLRYVRFVCRLVQDCSGTPEVMAAALRTLGQMLNAAQRAAGGSLLAEPLRQLALFVQHRGGNYSRPVLQSLLRYMLAEAANRTLPFLHREATHGDIVGWNELTYCRGEHLILCGMHDDCVPARPLTDIFLPDALRCAVGITSSESRTARDAFLLTALLNSHPGCVHFIVARSRADGAPPAPSSLLLRCGQNRAELAARAAYLFREPEEVARRKEYRHWNLLHGPEDAESEAGMLCDLRRADGSAADNPFAPDHPDARPFSPSLINTFLSCPLRFWLQHAFGLCPSDAYPEDLSELQGNQYGDLMHEVLRRFTEHYDAADKLPEGDEASQLEILRAETDSLTETCYRRYGDTSQALLLVQKEQMAASLRDFARCHLADLLAGWRVVWREEKVTPTLRLEDGSTAPFSMRLDRVDFNDRTGQWRIIDYKSNDKTPDAAHYAPLGVGEEPPELFNTELAPCAFSERYTLKNGETRLHHFRRSNVQLPLYAMALRQLCTEQEQPYSFPLLGYYNLPRGRAEASFTPLHTKEKPQQALTEAYEEGFLDCVRRVVLLIRSGACLRSAESLGFKSPAASFGALSPDDDPRSLCGMKAAFTPDTPAVS